MRSDDPDLNRPSSSRRGNASGSNRASQRYRSAAASTSGRQPSSRNNVGSNGRRPKRPPQPKTSACILHILEDDIEETRVQNLFAPDKRTQRRNVSYRPLSLTQQALRDGDAFRLPSLGTMCCSVIASCFDALLPSRDQFDAATGPRAASSSKPIRNSHSLTKSSKARKRSRARAFGAAPDSDEDQQDYVPSDEDANPAGKGASKAPRSRRPASGTESAVAGESTSSQLLEGWTTTELHYLTRKTSQQLKLLSPAASFLLFQALVEHAPQYLTKAVITDYFLPPVLATPTSSSSSSAVTSLAASAARTHVWLPASLPLLSQDKSAAPFLVAHLHSALSSTREQAIRSQSSAEDMPLAALSSRTLLVPPPSFALRSLQLHGLTRLQDGTIARFFEAAVSSTSSSHDLQLDLISLKGCIAVGDRTVKAICQSTGATLRYLNLDFTDVTADAISMVMKMAPNLHTLKLGYNEHVTDKTLQAALQAPASGELPFSKLVNLRLRGCKHVGDLGVACFLKYVHRTLEVLDISGTNVGGSNAHNTDFHMLLMAFFPLGIPEAASNHATATPLLPLRKLNLLEANIDYNSLVKLVDRAPKIDTLLLRQMPSRATRDGLIQLLEKLTSSTGDGGWGARAWKRLHLQILDVGDEFADLFPSLLTILPVSVHASLA